MDTHDSVHSAIPLVLHTVDLAIIPGNNNASVLKGDT